MAARAFIMVWDGLRPDLVSEVATPSLWRLARQGVWFSKSHAVFPTLTRANAAAMASGCRPGRTGIAGNSFCLRRTGPLVPFSTADAGDLRRLTEDDGLPLVLVDTLADRVHRAGGRTVIVSSGSPGSALIQDPRAVEYGDLILVAGLPEMRDRMEEVSRRFGPVPVKTVPATELNGYLTRVIGEYVLPELAPTLLIFWHTDPDHTTHACGLSAPETMRALRDADENLGSILAAYDRLGLRAETDVFVTSDHGASTVARRVDPASDFASFLSGRAAAENGGAGLFYTADPAALPTLRQAEYVGPMFTRDGGPGSFPLALVGLDGPRAPDIVCSFAWGPGTADGPPGTSVGTHPRAFAAHGTISPYEIRNTLVAQGPDLRQAWEDPLPAGVVDIAPTVTRLLRLDDGTAFEGRLLAEALRGADQNAPPWRMEEVATAFSIGRAEKIQRLQFARIGEISYLAGGLVDNG